MATPGSIGRYQVLAIQYARNVIEDPDYENEEFSMDWFERERRW